MRCQIGGIIFVLLFFNACGSLDKIAVNTVASILYDATYESEQENNWEQLKKGLPGNLKLMEGLRYLDPDNTDLLVSLVKGYTGQAFAVNETLYLDDYLADRNGT